jgi:hypothetical protein
MSPDVKRSLRFRIINGAIAGIAQRAACCLPGREVGAELICRDCMRSLRALEIVEPSRVLPLEVKSLLN